MNSSYAYDEDVFKTEPEIPIDVKVEETDECMTEEFIQYEYLEDSEIDANEKDNPDKIDFKTDNSSNQQRADSATSESDDDVSEKSNDSISPVVRRSDKSRVSTAARKRGRPIGKKIEDSDPDFPDPTIDTDSTDTFTDISTERRIISDRINLKHYKRTISRSGCVFKDCDKKDTALVPNIVRRKLLQEYKLYILKSSEVCSVHGRDQNWEDLLLCTYDDFSAIDIEDILRLLKQASQASLDFEKIEHVPTRLIRYWMNVNKVQFERIYSSYPLIKTLTAPKAALSLYLMYLQNNDVGRISLLLQVPETQIMDRIRSIQAIIPCKTYDELNKMFKLEY